MVNQGGNPHIHLVLGLGKGKMNVEHDTKLSGGRLTQNFRFREVKPLLGQFLADHSAFK